MLSAISDAEDSGAEQNRLIARGRQISEEFPTLTPDLIRAILMTLVSRIDIKAEHVEISVYRHRLHDLIKARWLEPFLADRAPVSHPNNILTLKVKARLQRVGREMKLVVHNIADRAAADPGLLRIVARAHDFQERLLQDPDLTVPAIASQERLTIGYLSRLLRLPSLAPDIVTAIINGKHPPELSAKRLMRLRLQNAHRLGRTAEAARVSGGVGAFDSRPVDASLRAAAENVDPQMPPERFSCRGAREFDEKSSLPLRTESEAREISAEFATNSTGPGKTKNRSISSDLGWLGR